MVLTIKQNLMPSHLADDSGGLLVKGDCTSRGVLGNDGVEVAAVGVVGARGGVHAGRQEERLHGSSGSRRGQSDEGESEGKLRINFFGWTLERTPAMTLSSVLTIFT